MQLTRLMVPTSKYNIKCPYEMNADGICVHNTANKASAMAEISYMVGNNNQVSFHFAVDDYRIVQGVEENRNTWHAGDGRNGKGNRTKISIEICHSTNPDESMFTKSEKLAAKFIAYKLKEKGWGIERVSKHQDYNGKYCPHKTLDLGWERFLNLIRAELQELNKTNTTTSSKNVLYKVQVGAFSKIDNANKLVNELKAKGIESFIVKDNNLYKVQCGAFSNKQNAINLGNKLKGMGYSVYIQGLNEAVNSTPISFKVGQVVTLKTSASKYATGQTIPSHYKGKKYTIQQVGNGKCLLKELYSWVFNKDIN